MKIVITGGEGFIGSALARYLADDPDNQIVLIDNLAHCPKPHTYAKWTQPNVCSIHVDIRPTHTEEYDEALAEWFEGADLVYHFAAVSNLALCQTNPVYAFDVNVTGTINTFEVARKVGVQTIVFASSSAVMENGVLPSVGGRGGSWAPPDLMYSMSKGIGEDICMSYINNYGMDVRIMRIFNSYGADQDHTRSTPPFVPYLVNCALTDQSPIIYGDGEQRRDWIYIYDVVQACEKVAISEKLLHFPGWINHIGTGESHSVLEMVEILGDITGKKITPQYKPWDTMWDCYPSLFEGEYPFRKGRVAQEAAKETISPTPWTQRLLDWKPTIGLEQGLRFVVDDMREKLNV